jgi:flagella basal body P-ring formation protein FlgA
MRGFLVCLCWILLAPLLRAGDAELRFPREVHVAGRQLLLGQVAEIHSADIALEGRLRAWSLGYTPAPTFSRLVSVERLRSDLARDFPGERLRFSGETNTRVWPLLETIPAATQAAAAERALAEIAQGREFLFTPMNALPDLAVPAGQAPARLVARVPSQSLAQGALEVTLEVHVDEALYRTVRLPYKAESFEVLPVLVRDIQPGEALGPNDFVLQRRALQPNQPTALTVAMASGSLASRALRAGNPVSNQDVHRPLAIVAGSSVFVEVRRGSVSARSLGLALDSGSVGDRIRVQLAGNAREMRAVIASRDLVVVSLDPQSSADAGRQPLR